tara:strand:+ start:306 stop:569 length:264 start_codon:yes stop_codon:yes gene_type:complete
MSIREDIGKTLTEHVAPSLAMHGGAIEFLEYNEDTRNVHVKLTGSCAGCSASTITLKIGVENTLFHFYPEDVRSVTHEEGEIISPYY